MAGGPCVLWNIRQEERRLARGWTYEPPTFYDVNNAEGLNNRPSASQCRYVTPHAVSPQGTEDTLGRVQEPGAGQTVQSQKVQNVQ
jgi:hypothetical protein